MGTVWVGWWVSLAGEQAVGQALVVAYALVVLTSMQNLRLTKRHTPYLPVTFTCFDSLRHFLYSARFKIKSILFLFYFAYWQNYLDYPVVCTFSTQHYIFMHASCIWLFAVSGQVVLI